MDDSSHAIEVTNVSKSYRIWSYPSARVESGLLKLGASLFPDRSPVAQGLNRMAQVRYRDFFALRDFSMYVGKGESVGVIGLNGSGKSTLLQIIAGTVQPTSGTVNVCGKVGALLELGSGFNPDFTGRENVYLNGAILGLTREQVDERFEKIASFADIGDFIDQPVKTYSSGMFVRLAFAVTTNVSAEILLIDEALTVGDVFFRQKCYAHLDELRARGVAIVLVTHGMNDVEQFCSRTYLLHHGRLQVTGPSPEVVKRYYLINQQTLVQQAAASASKVNETETATPASAEEEWPSGNANMITPLTTQVADGTARLNFVTVTDAAGKVSQRFEQGDLAIFYYEFELLRPIEIPIVGIVLYSDKGIIVHGKNSLEYGSDFECGFSAGARLRFRHEIKLELAVGEYTFEVGCASATAATVELAPGLSHMELTNLISRHCHVVGLGPFEIAFRTQGRPVQLLHHGVANLPGNVECLNAKVRT